VRLNLGRTFPCLGFDLVGLFRMDTRLRRIFSLDTGLDTARSRDISASSSLRDISCKPLVSVGFCSWSRPISPKSSNKVRAAIALALAGAFASLQTPSNVCTASARIRAKSLISSDT
jgi:hypothetical protein